MTKCDPRRMNMKSGAKNPSHAGPPSVSRKLREFLSDPKSYPHRPQRVKVIETHSAVVFMASPYVYKIKKPVDLGFLDFSTLEKRRHFCRREVELNERLCEGVYQGVVAIKRRQDGLGFRDGGRTVEYAVKMKELSPRGFLHHRLRRGEARPRDLDRVADKLRDFYLAQHPTREIESWGRVAKLKISTDENFQQTESFVGVTLTETAWRTLRWYTKEFFRRRRRLFESRVRDEWIRDCHGDLHLEHIHLTERSLHIYDCIEFNDRFRYVDVANDAAFLAMDLDHQGRPDLSCHFVRRMARALGDARMLELVDFYKCYRAYVRGKVESFQGEAEESSEKDRQAHVRQAKQYFRQALGYAVVGSHPLVLAVMGGVASGKSTLAGALGEELGWRTFSSDTVRKELSGLPPAERPSAAGRAKLYSARRTRQTYAKLIEWAESETAGGRSVILDATFSRRSMRRELIRHFQRTETPVIFIEARVGEEAARRRLRQREGESVVSDARLEDYEKLAARYEPPSELSDLQKVVVDTSAPPSKVLAGSLRGLIQLQM